MGLNVARVVLEGELGDVALPELVQLFCGAKNSREIDVTFEGDHLGRLVVHGGRVIRCVAFGRVGLDAFFQLMQQRQGRYEVRVVSERSSGSIHPSLAETTWESLLIEAARRQDASAGAAEDDIDFALSGFDAFVAAGEPPGLLPPPMEATPHVSLPPIVDRAPLAQSRRRESSRGVPAIRRLPPDGPRRRDSASFRPSSLPPPVESPVAEPKRIPWEAPKPRRPTSIPPLASSHERPGYGSEWEPLASRPSSRAPRFDDGRLPHELETRGGLAPAGVAAPRAPEASPVSEAPPASGETLDDVRYDPEDATLYGGDATLYGEEATLFADEPTLFADEPTLFADAVRASLGVGVVDDAARTQVQRRGLVEPPPPRPPPPPPPRSPRFEAPIASEPRGPSPPPPPSSGSISSQSATILRERATEAYLRRDLHLALKLFEASLALAPQDERSQANVARIKAKLGLR